MGLLTLPARVHLASRASPVSSSAHHGVLHGGAPVGGAGAGGVVHGGQVSLLQGLGQLPVG